MLEEICDQNKYCGRHPYASMSTLDFLNIAPCPPSWNTALLWEAATRNNLSKSHTDVIARRCNVPEVTTTLTFSPLGGVLGDVSTHSSTSAEVHTRRTSRVINGSTFELCNIACILAIIVSLILLVVIGVIITTLCLRRRHKRKASKNSSAYFRNSMASTNSTQDLYPINGKEVRAQQRRWDDLDTPTEVMEPTISFRDSPPFTRLRNCHFLCADRPPDPTIVSSPNKDSNSDQLEISVIALHNSNLKGYVYVNPSLKDHDEDLPKSDYDLGIPYIDEDPITGHTYATISSDHPFDSERL